ncbi:MAG: adenylate kinase [Bacteroidetes bacterium]|nr:adenylate kinase [Bacteroidota bacterium]
MLNIVIFGPPGSGKGTQSVRLKEKYGLVHLSTGDILRDAMTKKTPLGVKAQEYMEKGELVPDEDVIGMLMGVLDENMDSNGFIFDGFPRTEKQALFLKENLEKRDTMIHALLTLDVDREELIKRLIERGKESGRSDDELSVIENRINVYHNQTAPVIEFYKKLDKYYPVAGMGTIDEIFDRLCKVIEEVNEMER